MGETRKEITNIIMKYVSCANLTHMDESVEMGYWMPIKIIFRSGSS